MFVVRIGEDRDADKAGRFRARDEQRPRGLFRPSGRPVGRRGNQVALPRHLTTFNVILGPLAAFELLAITDYVCDQEIVRPVTRSATTPPRR